MRVLMEFATSNYRTWNSFAKEINKIYPGSKFAGIVGLAPGTEYILDFLNGQEDIKYEFLSSQHAITREAMLGNIDYDELKEFESNLPAKSLWRMISTDRAWGNAFIHGAIPRQSFASQKSSRENILKIASGTIKRYRSLFDRFQPDIFIPAIAMQSMSVMIFEQICKEKGIPYIVPDSVRVKNYFAYADNVQLRFPHIEERYGQLYEGDFNVDMVKARELYDDLTGELADPNYFDRKNPWFNIAKIDTPMRKVKFLITMLRSLGYAFLSWVKNSFFDRANDIGGQPASFSALRSNLSYAFYRHYQKVLMLKSEFRDKLPKGQKYIYYPLHVNPEYSTQVIAPMWLDQLYVIELLAKSIPSDWIVYVKEHPTTLYYRARPVSFYSRIKRYPNVRMAPIDANTHELIANSEMVAAITGTSGWEAILRSKPLITFADCLWSVMGLSRKCTDVETLSNAIHDEMIRVNKISDEERKKRIICYLTAILEHSFEITYPVPFCSNKGTVEQYEFGGKEAAYGLKKYMEYLKSKNHTETI
ncbi:MAG: hypothetical protein ABH869_00105 [Candidatus Omnitrophota bacterium]